MVVVVIEPSLKYWLSRIKEVERWEVIPHQGGRALGSYSTSRRSSVGKLFRIEEVKRRGIVPYQTWMIEVP